MLRRVIQFVELSILGLTLITLLLWAWSYHEYDSVIFEFGIHRANVYSCAGECFIEMTSVVAPQVREPGWLAIKAAHLSSDGRSFIGRYGLEYAWWKPDLKIHFQDYGFPLAWELSLPYWVPAVVLLPIALFRSVRKGIDKLPAPPRLARARLSRSLRLIILAVVVVAAMYPVVVYSFRFNTNDGINALIDTPALYIVFGLVPIVLIIAVRAPLNSYKRRLNIRRHRRRCAECGYDLTANTSGVCPECGMSLSVGVQQR